MFDVAPSEFLLVALLALVVIGPKDLPRVMRFVGKWVGKARAVAGQFRSGFDDMVRQSELQELEKKWAEENARIMAAHPAEPAPSREYDSLPPPDQSARDDSAEPKPEPLP
jgi:sec-independent protein translocase protein TatB